MKTLVRRTAVRGRSRASLRGGSGLSLKLLVALFAAASAATLGLSIVQARPAGLASGLTALHAACGTASPRAVRAGWRALRGVSVLLTTKVASPDRVPSSFPGTEDLRDAPGPAVPRPAPRLASVGLVPSVGILGAARGLPVLPPPPDSRR